MSSLCSKPKRGPAIPILVGAAAIVFGLLVWSVARGGRPAALNITLTSLTPFRTAMISVVNTNSRPFVIWQPYYVERQQGKSIVVGSGQSGRDESVIIRGRAGSHAVTSISVRLTGEDHGKWRLVAPVSGYGFLGGVDSLLKKRIGWTLSFPAVRFVVRRFSRTVASDWMDETPVMGLAMGPVDHQAFRELLQRFQSDVGRWPTNQAEVKAFAAEKGLSPPAARFDEATMLITEEDGLKVTFPSGGMTLSKGIGSPPPPAVSNRFAEIRAGFAARTSESSTFSFIVRNFRAHFGRWPRDIAELNEFGRRTLQPAIPERFAEAKLLATEDGGFKVISTNGTMILSTGSNSVSQTPVQMPKRISDMRAAAQERQRNSKTFTSILRSFRSQFERWPSDMKELTEFCRDHSQPAIPEPFADAKFDPRPDGSIDVTYQDSRARMTLR